MNQIDFMSILFGIILTYGIGLLPALFIRFVVFRRALSKFGALVICIFWFLIWSCLIISLRSVSGEAPRLSGGSFFMIVLSYIILSKGYIKQTKNTTNRDNTLLLVIHCPQCGRSLKGATKDMIGDTGVCQKCKAEFTIEGNNEEDTKYYGGISRTGYFFGILGLTFIGNIFVVATLDLAIISFIQIIAITLSFVLVVYRLHNIGMNGWWSLLILVPLANLFIGVKCVMCPEGYQDTQKLDTAGRIIAAILIGFVISAIVMGIIAWRQL